MVGDLDICWKFSLKKGEIIDYIHQMMTKYIIWVSHKMRTIYD